MNHEARIRSTLSPLHRVGVVTALGGIFLAALTPFLDPDLFWHLRSGALITALGHLPATDTLSFTAAGQPWLNHEWLGDVLIHYIHRAAGLWSVLFFFAIVFTIALALAARRSLARGASIIAVLFSLLVALVISSGTIGPRMQTLTLLFTSLILLILESDKREPRWQLLAILPVLILLWSNLHGAFVVGLVVQTFYMFGDLVRRGQGNERHWAARLLALLTSIAASLLNPNGFEQLIYPLTFLRRNTFTAVIAESARPDFSHPASIVFFVSLAVLIFAMCRRWRTISTEDFCVVAAFTFLALQQVRHLALWAVAVTPILASFVDAMLREGKRDAGAERPKSHRPNLDKALMGIVVASYLLLIVRYLRPQRLAEIEVARYPGAALASLSDPLVHNIFNTYEWGGYILWKTPGRRVFIDGRADTVYDDDVLLDYLQVYAAEPGWNRKLSIRGADALVVETDSRIAHAANSSPDWRSVYRDKVSTAFVRR